MSAPRLPFAPRALPADSPRRRYTLHPVASGAFTMRFLATGLTVLAVVAAGIGVYFIALRGWGAVVLTVAGAVLLYAYDAAPRALKELGLGEVAAFCVWGPLMIGGGYYVITGHWSGLAFPRRCRTGWVSRPS